MKNIAKIWATNIVEGNKTFNDVPTKLKERNGMTDDLKNKIDVFFACGRITEEQYNELMDVAVKDIQLTR